MSTQGIQVPDSKYLAWVDVKDPQATKDYILDLAGDSNGGYLQGDVITTVVSVIPDSFSGLVIGDGSNGANAPTTDGTRIILWLVAGGDIGNWEIVIRFTTSKGITEELTRVVRVANT